MNALNKIIRAFQIDAYNKRLWAEQAASYLFNVVVSLEVVVLGFLINTPSQCLEDIYTVDFAIENITATDHINAGNYLTLLCGTQIKLNATAFYFLRLGFLIFTGLFLGLSKFHVGKLNKYENVVTGHKLPKYVGPDALDKRRDYHLALSERAATFFWWKLGLLITYTLLVVTLLVVQFADEDTADVMQPDSFSCTAAGQFVSFSRDFNNYRCHFDAEFLIQLSAAVTDTLKVVLLIVFWLSLFFLRQYMSVLDTLPAKAAEFRATAEYAASGAAASDSDSDGRDAVQIEMQT